MIFYNNPDFYPTPSAVIDKMLTDDSPAGLVVLEPSAGSGNIVRKLNECGAAEVLVCEKDPNLQRVLRGEKCRLIASDFLTVTAEEVSHVRMIVMNPPFSQGARHIEHAYNIAPAGCVIVSLVNSSNLGSSYLRSYNKLQELVKLHGYSEDLGAVFAEDAERQTRCRVSLVKLWKEGEGEEEFSPEEIREHQLIPVSVDSPEDFSLNFCESVTAAHQPAQIIIEFNGMWNLQEFLQKDFPSNWGLAGIYSTVNGAELELVMTNMRNLFMNQHTDSDLIVVNRCRPNTDRVTFRKAIKLQNAPAQLIFEAENGDIIEFGEEDLPYDVKADAFEVEEVFRPFGMAKTLFVPGRRVMACCAEDVQFYGFPCKTEKPFSFPNRSWHWITVEFDMEKKKDPRSGGFVQVPVLHYVDSKEAAAPKEEVVSL